MGEEYTEPAPFRYFVSHTDPELIEAVRRGRREEFADFAWQGEAPDPQSEETFRASTIDLDLAHDGGDHEAMFALYRDLLALRRRLPVLHDPAAGEVSATLAPDGEAIALNRRGPFGEVVVAANTGSGDALVVLPAVGGVFEESFTTAGRHHGGEDPAGAPRTDGSALVIPLTRRSARVFVRAGTLERLPT